MDNKMKGIIGGVVGLVVILILVFSFGGSSNSPEAIAKQAITIGENVLNGIEKAENKDDLKKLYKETVNEVAEMIPSALGGITAFIESNGGAEEIGKPENMAKLMGDFATVIGDAEKLQKKFEALDKNTDLNKKMEKIGESMTDSDLAELLKFTLDRANALIETIANDSEAMNGLNYLASQGGSSEKVTKEMLLEFVKEYKKEFDEMDAEDMAEYFNNMF